jgi:toxin ParE1/3/4
VHVRWLPGAQINLLEIADYVAQDNSAAAYALLDAIRRHVGRLGEHARLGRPGRVKGTRELVVPGVPYIVAYRVAANTVTILRILHGARLWPAKL